MQLSQPISFHHLTYGARLELVTILYQLRNVHNLED